MSDFSYLQKICVTRVAIVSKGGHQTESDSCFFFLFVICNFFHDIWGKFHEVTIHTLADNAAK